MGVTKKKTIRDVPLDNLTVLVRTDFDVPIDEVGIVSDDSLIKKSLPTIEHLLDRGCKVVVVSHRGAPNSYDMNFSLEPAAARLANLLNKDIRFVDGIIGDKVYQAVKRAPKNCVIVLENLRFHPGEMDNDHDFASKLVKSTNARYFVQDCPSILHRLHASSDLILQHIPGVAGFNLEDADLITYKLPGVEGLLDART